MSINVVESSDSFFGTENLVSVFMGEIRNLNNIMRFNNRFVTHHMTVSSHTFYVTVYSLLISKKMSLSPRLISCVLEMSLKHDVEESEYGDILVPAKSELIDADEYESFSDKIRDELLGSSIRVSEMEHDFCFQIVRFSDKVEGLITSLEEVEMGNRYFVSIAYSHLEVLSHIAESSHILYDLYVAFRNYSESILNQIDLNRDKLEVKK